ncbi:hypothetical protein [Micromonospora sp. NPDC007230]|uniref:hypothetical protein n=1 Tax=Micromonospora sp. NPDC007230 TaxID=3364237 RepID=UPI0036A75990
MTSSGSPARFAAYIRWAYASQGSAASPARTASGRSTRTPPVVSGSRPGRERHDERLPGHGQGDEHQGPFKRGGGGYREGRRDAQQLHDGWC